MTATNARTVAIVNYLRMKGHFVWRQNNNSVYDPTKKIFRKNSAMPGVPDILGICKDGKGIAVEVKTGKDRLSDMQRQFQQRWISNNGIYIVASSVDDLINAGY